MRLAPKENFRCPFKYQGQCYDSEVELCYNRFRYYHPETGRYISQDPIKLLGGFNVFAYVGDTNAWVDLLGLRMGNLLVDIMIMKLDINLIELLISMLGVKAQAQVLKIMFIYTMNNTL